MLDPVLLAAPVALIALTVAVLRDLHRILRHPGHHVRPDEPSPAVARR